MYAARSFRSWLKSSEEVMITLEGNSITLYPSILVPPPHKGWSNPSWETNEGSLMLRRNDSQPLKHGALALWTIKMALPIYYADNAGETTYRGSVMDSGREIELVSCTVKAIHSFS
jgi:hypothetical protein